jgi:hypothetical protein
MNPGSEKIMNRLFVLIATFILITSLATACTSSSKRGTEVTRFHLDDPIPAQAVNLKDIEDNSIEMSSYTELVTTELARIGFPVTDSETTGLFVDIDMTRGMQVKPQKQSPVSVGLGAGSYGGNVGLSGGVSLPIGGGPQEVYVTNLEVKFIDREKNSIIWEGRAAKETAAAPENPTAVMQQVVSALFQDFPGESGKTIVVADTPTTN